MQHEYGGGHALFASYASLVLFCFAFFEVEDTEWTKCTHPQFAQVSILSWWQHKFISIHFVSPRSDSDFYQISGFKIDTVWLVLIYQTERKKGKPISGFLLMFFWVILKKAQSQEFYSKSSFKNNSNLQLLWVSDVWSEARAQVKNTSGVYLVVASHYGKVHLLGMAEHDIRWYLQPMYSLENHHYE